MWIEPVDRMVKLIKYVLQVSLDQPIPLDSTFSFLPLLWIFSFFSLAFISPTSCSALLCWDMNVLHNLRLGLCVDFSWIFHHIHILDSIYNLFLLTTQDVRILWIWDLSRIGYQKCPFCSDIQYCNDLISFKRNCTFRSIGCINVLLLENSFLFSTNFSLIFSSLVLLWVQWQSYYFYI